MVCTEGRCRCSHLDTFRRKYRASWLFVNFVHRYNVENVAVPVDAASEEIKAQRHSTSILTTKFMGQRTGAVDIGVCSGVHQE